MDELKHEVNIKSILEMARGGIQELVDYEMSRILENILDVNTKATAARELSVTLEFKPDDYRQTVEVSAQVKSALATTSPVRTALYLHAGADGVVATEMTPQIPGQTSLLGGDQGPAPQLKVIKSA